MQRATKWFLGLLGSVAILFGGFVILHGSLQPASVNSWLSAGNMSVARAGAATVLLQDGRLLITGGNGASGALASTEILDPSSGFTAGPPMSIARSNHVAVLLLDGRVLVAGGTGADGRASQSAELFDPVANSWSASGPLMVGRSGATATLLPSGQVLIAGGTANGAALASLELFDPNSNTFSLVAGTLSSARENHAAALLPDGRVLIAGGWDGTTVAPVAPATTGGPNVLASTDIFDPATGAVAPGPALTSPRMNFTATTALDGSVAAIGGTDGQNDLASIDILVSGAGAFGLSGAQLTTARQGHQAFLLPHNGNILVVGGTSSGTAVSAVELYTPWTGATSVTGAMASARSAATGSPLFQMVLTAPVGIDGALIVAGGLDASSPPATLSSAEVYGFATIKTDKGDYQPGDTVNISGSGWLPGETVQMSLVEVPDLDGDSPIALTATADANGNISSVTFPINVADLNVHFTLTAVGGVSQAQTTFTDTTNVDETIVADHNPSTTGQLVTFTATVTVHNTTTVVTEGSVQFRLGGTNCAGGAGTAIGSAVALNGSGQAQQTYTFTAATAGTKIFACYGGTATYGAQTASMTQVVNAFGPVTHFLVTTSTATPTAGSPFSVTVTAQDASNATVTSYIGTVHFSVTNTDSGKTLPGDYTFTTGAGNDNGVHTFTNGVTLTVAGAQTINVNDTVTTTITGSADVTVGAGTATKLAFTTSAQTLVVGQCSNIITVQSQDSSGNPSDPSTSVQVNLSILSGGAGGFFSDSSCATSINSVTILSIGNSASFYFKGTSVGSPTTIKAADNANVLAAATQDEMVGKADTTTTVTRITGPSSSVYGQPLTFQAAVTANSPGSGTPTGNVTFYDGGTCAIPGTVLQAATAINGSGLLDLNISTLSVSGSPHTILACYAGDTNYYATGADVGSVAVTVSQSVIKADTTTTVTSSPTVTFGTQTVTLSASVTANSPSTATVSEGTVTFKIENAAETLTLATVTGVTVTNGSASTSTYSIVSPYLYNVGTYHIYASYVPATTNPNFIGSMSSAYGTLIVNPATAVASVTVTPLYYSAGPPPTTNSTNPAPGNCSVITGPCQQYSDEVNFTVTVSPGMINGVYPLDPVNTCVVADDDVPCVNIKVVGASFAQGFKIYGPIPLTLDSGTGNLVGTLDNQQILQMPGPYTATVVPISTVDPNFILNTTTGRGSLTVVQEDAQALYTGAQYFSSTSSTMSIQVSFNLQDATATGTDNSIYDPWAGDITKAKLSLGLQDVNSSTPIDAAECQSLPVAGTPGAVDPTNGLPSTGSVTCTFDNVPVGATYTLTASPANGSFYIFSAGDTAVTITTATGGTGFITGGGYQSAKYLGATGGSGSNKYTAAGLLTPAAGTKVNFGFEGKYQKKNSKLQGGVNIIIRSSCVAAGIGGTSYVPNPIGGLCVYQIKVPQGQLTSLNETLTPTPPWAEMAGGANIYDITRPDNIQQVANSQTAILQLQMYDIGDPAPGANVDPLSIQITDSRVGLWFSNNWSGTQTVISISAPVINGGNLQVH
jgi:Bacterial Ig-like domain (group 3)/Galactose oxidase, central domain